MHNYSPGIAPAPGKCREKCVTLRGLYIKNNPRGSEPKPMTPGDCPKIIAVYINMPPGKKRRSETILQG